MGTDQHRSDNNSWRDELRALTTELRYDRETRQRDTNRQQIKTAVIYAAATVGIHAAARFALNSKRRRTASVRCR